MRVMILVLDNVELQLPMQYLTHGYGFINTSKMLLSKLSSKLVNHSVRPVKMITNCMNASCLISWELEIESNEEVDEAEIESVEPAIDV